MLATLPGPIAYEGVSPVGKLWEMNASGTYRSISRSSWPRQAFMALVGWRGSRADVVQNGAIVE